MKLFQLLLFIGLFSLLACEKDKTDPVPSCENCNLDCIDPNDSDALTNDCLDNYTCIFAIATNAKVNTDEYDGVATGNKNVFQITTSTEGDSGIADDEFTNILVFELDEIQESFDVDGDDLALLKTNYRKICFCSETEFKEIKTGCLQGAKNEDGDWVVQGNLEVEYGWGILPVKFEVLMDN